MANDSVSPSTGPANPTDDDKKRNLEYRHYTEDNQLKGQPYLNEQCDNCHYYLNPDDKLSYCWHPKIRILVGGQWWCQWWEETIDEAAADDLVQLEPKPIDEKNNAELQKLIDSVTLKAQPYDNQRCDNCHYYHIDANAPTTEKIAYCWHEKLHVLVGDDWWCDRWEELRKG